MGNNRLFVAHSSLIPRSKPDTLFLSLRCYCSSFSPFHAKMVTICGFACFIGWNRNEASVQREKERERERHWVPRPKRGESYRLSFCLLFSISHRLSFSQRFVSYLVIIIFSPSLYIPYLICFVVSTLICCSFFFLTSASSLFLPSSPPSRYIDSSSLLQSRCTSLNSSICRTLISSSTLSSEILVSCISIVRYRW